jgi:hypothetical protein
MEEQKLNSPTTTDKLNQQKYLWTKDGMRKPYRPQLPIYS